MTLYEDLKWRGLIQDISSPDLIDRLNAGGMTFYIGTDPTADSLHLGHYSSFLITRRLAAAGHTPLLLVGMATGLIGDPRGTVERKLSDRDTVMKNFDALKTQLQKIFPYEVVNNYDWVKDITVIDFFRDYGKHINVGYMLSKDHVRRQMESGISYAEFSYMLIQGLDFKYLHEHRGVDLQVAGSDQWGNITTGTELIRRKLGAEAEAFGITCPLITKADGTKFGKTESGNVWLDPRYTSPYKFCQFWLNVSDEDAKRYIKIFTLLDRETIDALIAEHDAAPHLRVLQKRLAEEITCMIHSHEEYEKAVEASAILFGGATSEALHRLDEQTLLQVFEGVPQYRVARTELAAGIPFVDLCAEKSDIFASKGECRKLVQGGGVSLNKEKLADAMRPVTDADLIAGKYLLVQRGKKNYYLVIAE